MFKFVRTIAFYAFSPLNSAWKCRVSPLPAIFTLGDFWVHICSPYHSNVITNVEASINKEFSILTTLNVPDINPDYSHIWLRRNLDNSRFGSQRNIVENVVLFENGFDVRWRKFFLRVRVRIERDSGDFQVWFRLGKSWTRLRSDLALLLS